jgi:hypothetical protein
VQDEAEVQDLAGLQDKVGVQESDLAAARGSVQVVRWWFDVAELSSL